MKHALDLTKVWEKYRGQWVALTASDEVISSDIRAKKAHEEAIRKGYNEPILFKVPKHDFPHIG